MHRFRTSFRSRPWLFLLVLSVLLVRALPVATAAPSPHAAMAAMEAPCGDMDRAAMADHAPEPVTSHGCCGAGGEPCGLHCVTPLTGGLASAAEHWIAPPPVLFTPAPYRHRAVPPPLRPPRA